MGEAYCLRRTVFIIIWLLIAVSPSFAENKDAYVAGKVFDIDQKTPVNGVPVRLVNMNTGQARDTKTQQEGCYSFKGVPQGTYSLSVSHHGMDYLLTEKIKVDLLEREVAVAVCVAMTKDNKLALLENCHVCLGKGFPPLGIFFIAGSSAAAATSGIIITTGEDPIVSPSVP